MTKNLENKLGRESIIKASFNYSKKKILPYALTGLVLFSSAIAPVYAETKKVKEETAKQYINKKPSFWNHLNPFYSYKSLGKTTNFLISTTKILSYALVGNEIYNLTKEKDNPNPPPTPDPTPVDPIASDPTGDYDKDEMPNKYELDHGLNPKIDDANEDKDGDGYKNIIEYREGSDPDNASSIPQGDSHYLRVLSINNVSKAIYSKSPLETSLSINPANSYVGFVLPCGKNVIISGKKAIANREWDIKASIKF